MTKKSILCCAFICILLPAFTQEFSTPYIQTSENDGTTASAENAGTAVLVEQDSPAVVKGENTAEVIKDEKKFGITPVLMLSAWGIEPGISVQIFQGEAEVSVPVTISLQNKAGVGVTAGFGFNSNPFNEGIQHGVGLSFTHYPESYMNATLLGSIIENTNSSSTSDVVDRITTMSVYYRFGYRWDLGLGVFIKFYLPLVGWYGEKTLTSFNIAGLLLNGMVGLTQTSIGIRFTF